MGVSTIQDAIKTMGKGTNLFKDWRDFNPTEETVKKFEEYKKEQDQIQREEIRRAERRGYTSLSPQDWQVVFESLEVTPQNELIIARIKKWTPEHQKGIVLYGTVGTGKTYLAKCLINRWAKHNFRCLFISTASAIQRLKDSIDADGRSVSDETAALVAPDLLILDDLGAEKTSDWSIERLFVIVEERAKHDRKTIFTSNLTTHEIAKIYGDRIQDRLVERCTWVKVDGDSFRRKNYRPEI